MIRPAITRLYAAFAGVPRPERMDGCPHCVGSDESRCLLDRPLATLEPEALSRYAAKAVTTWGGAAELRYFTPRLLECALTGATAMPDVEIVLGKLALASWPEWPAAQRGAVRDLLAAWWRETLRAHPGSPPVGTVLCAIAATGIDLKPFLDHWDGALAQGDVGRAHLRDFMTYDVAWTPEPKLTNAFWRPGDVAYRDVVRWLGAVENPFA